MKKAKNKAKNHEGKITRNRRCLVGSNPTPPATAEPRTLLFAFSEYH